MIWLLATLAVQVQAPQEAGQAADGATPSAQAIAIRCSGRGTDTDSRGRKNERPNETRIYVIDPNANSVSFYNSALGTLTSICNDSPGCSPDIMPHMVVLAWHGDKDAISLVIDRRSGELWTSYHDDLIASAFTGTCVKTEMPRPNLGENRF